MNVLLFESVAFGISVIGFVYGLVTIYLTDSPLYFKTIISAVGCYALEELWVIVDVLTNAEDAVLSVRLIGIVGCFCAFLAATRILGKTIADGEKKKFCTRALLGPLVLAAILAVHILSIWQTNPPLTTIVTCIVLLPAIIDSYYECKYILVSSKEDTRIRTIRPIAILILMEYGVSFVYALMHTQVLLGLWLDVLSAVVMALMVVFSRKGADKW